ncbi:MAG: CopG family ribbon-helix-helix protein [Desulfovibrio sp.]|uniref:CopG family ribbon-helix-helix protein n=1 Tax=Desulfovibrio sp. 7SRBS1 TaxID=3378064 RepID=UPI003B3F62B9
MPSMISTRFDAATLERLDEAVQALGQTRSGLIKNAVNHYLEYLTWYSTEVQKGLDDVKTGRVLSHEEVADKLKGLGVELD